MLIFGKYIYSGVYLYKQKQNTMNTKILNFINEETNREMLEEKTTKEVAVEFGLTVEQAYKELNLLFNQNLLLKLEPVNAVKFECCGWVRLND